MLDMGLIISITTMIDALLNNNTRDSMEALKSMSVDEQKYVYEAYFIYAFMWSLGGPVADDKTVNYRKQWNSFIKSISKVKFPEGGSGQAVGSTDIAEDFRFDATTREWVHWDQWVKPYELFGEPM